MCVCVRACARVGARLYAYMYVCLYFALNSMDVSVAEWLAWLTSNCGRIGAIGSSPSNGLRPNM